MEIIKSQKTKKRQQTSDVAPDVSLAPVFQTVDENLRPPMPDLVMVHRHKKLPPPPIDEHAFISDVSRSIQSMNPELAFRNCRETFDREFFESYKDSGFKHAVAAFLVETFGDRLPLWSAIVKRSPDVLDLL